MYKYVKCSESKMVQPEDLRIAERVAKTVKLPAGCTWRVSEFKDRFGRLGIAFAVDRNGEEIFETYWDLQTDEDGEQVDEYFPLAGQEEYVKEFLDEEVSYL